MLFLTLFILLVGCFTSWLTVHVLLSARFGQAANSEPQYHHTHTGYIPRIGGLGIMLGFLVTFCLCLPNLDKTVMDSSYIWGILFGAIGSFLLGFVDDFRPLGAKYKLLIQILIAFGAYKSGLSIERVMLPFSDSAFELGFFSLLLTIFWFVAIMNLINLIDGLDGLAGGVGLMLMILIAYLGFGSSLQLSTILALGMIGAIVGFLFHNFPPAKVYMGDSGAYLIGFTIAALSLLNSQKGTILAALVAPVLALALPIADVSFAMLRRGIKGLPLFRPDRNHIHHRLIRSGLSQRNTVLVLYGVSLFALVGGLLVFADQGRYLPIFLGFSFVVIIVTLRGNRISPDWVKSNLTESIRSRQDTRNALYLKNWLLVEVERMDTGKNFWSDFRFVLKKMGFCRAELSIGKDVRSFYVPNTLHDKPELLWVERHEIRAGVGMELVLYAEKDNLSLTQFGLISDIAAEALTQSSAKWKEINGETLEFTSVAVASDSYKIQKAKNLYRPTY